jgi:hypothetical protein
MMKTKVKKSEHSFMHKGLEVIVHYNYDLADTCSEAHIRQVLDSLYQHFEYYYPEIYEGLIIEIWNGLRDDGPKKPFVSKNNRVILTTDYLKFRESQGQGWSRVIADAMGYLFAYQVKFNNKGYIFRKWKDLRMGANNINLIETFVQDFVFMFANHSISKGELGSVIPDHIPGLRHLYLIWPWIGKTLSKRGSFILYKDFVQMGSLLYLGFIYLEFNWKHRSFSLNKITAQGYYTYSNRTDQWELVKKFTRK